ncbi:hypothetical protein BX616_007940 [Lobosporangium transversale]|nr:hypothetical protein BX616_007940 [Lobosporangium transversale]
MFSQLYSTGLGDRIFHRTSSRLNVTYFSPQPDPDLYTDPYQLKDLCNHLPETRKHPRGLLITDKTSDEPLKIFYWRQFTYVDGVVDWEKESAILCPFPPELQSFFDYLWSWHIKKEELKWEQGYAPCWFWYRNVPDWSRDKVQTCDTPSQRLKYISNSNYTEFREADIIYIDYPFYNYIQRPPFWDVRRMPPRVAHQRWVLEFGRESIGSYAHVALPSFLQQFDLTMGAPYALFDVPYPLMPISKETIENLANVQPKVPVTEQFSLEITASTHLMAWVISNCEPRNNRNELMLELIEKIGAHSYGSCHHNRDMPEQVPGEAWEKHKQNVLSNYAFTLAAENSNCVGYVTEKIYDAFASGAIPVYMGASDIGDFVPAGSYISALDFKTTDELVHFLKTVDRAPYYKWKEEVKVDFTKFCKNCHLSMKSLECRILDQVKFV